MRRAVFAVFVVLAGPVWALGQPNDDRVTRVEQWLKAVMRHEPGTTDEAAQRVASWSASDIRRLWIDANAIAQLMRDPRRSGFQVRAERQPATQTIRYSTLQLMRMKALACAGRSGQAASRAPVACLTR